MIPEFPEFTPLSLEDKAPLEAYLTANPPDISELTFTNLFAWQDTYQYQVTRFGDGFLLLKGHGRESAFLQPLVTREHTAALEACFAFLQAQGAVPHIERVGEDFLSKAELDPVSFLCSEDRANFDYVYSVPELIELRGERFHDKRNLVNQFRDKHHYTYRPLTPELVTHCLDFQHDWCNERRCRESAGLLQEQCAVFRILLHFQHLSTVGGAIEIDGRMVALTLGEALNPETFVIHIEKARARIIGLYQAINWEFLQHAATDFRFVNREQDLGIEGLRKAKLSYNPVRMVKKFRVESVECRV